MIRSLRMRLFLSVTAVSVIVLALLSVGIDQAVHRTLVAEFDGVLLEKARALASMVEQSGQTTHFDFQATQFPEFAEGPHTAYFELLKDGVPFQQSASLRATHLSATAPHGQEPPAWCLLPDGREGRRLTIAFDPLVETDDPAAGPPPTLLPHCLLSVAQNSAQLNQTLARLRWLLFGMCAAATLISGAGLVIVAGRATRPVAELAQRIERVRETDLSAILPADALPSELAPVVDRLNGLLVRLEDAFKREKAFTADVAHELRTPLAGLLATLQVARSRPREAAAYEAAIDKSLLILLQMQTLVENLLLLARAESGQLAVHAAAVDVAALVQECLLSFQEAAARRGLQFSMPPCDVLDAAADYELLCVVVKNLLDNAISYAAANSVIQVRMAAERDSVSLEIANTGHGLTPAELPELLKRFVRKDSSRSATGTHAGLGLSIAQRLVAVQHGTLTLRLDGDWFVARLDLRAARHPRH